jgi:hypothetical protein
MFAYFEDEITMKLDGVILKHCKNYYSYQSDGKCWNCYEKCNNDLLVCPECGVSGHSPKFNITENEEYTKIRQNVEKQIKLQIKKYFKTFTVPPYKFNARIEPDEVRKIYGNLINKK